MSRSESDRPRLSRNERRVRDSVLETLPRISYTVELGIDRYKLESSGSLNEVLLPESGCFSEQLSAWVYKNAVRSDWGKLLKLTHMEYVIQQLRDSVSFITELTTVSGLALDLCFERMDYDDSPRLMSVSFIDRKALDLLVDTGLDRLRRGEQVAAALSALQSSVFHVDASTSHVEVYFVSPEHADELKSIFALGKYEDMLRAYAETFVLASDRGALLEMCDLGSVCRRLEDNRLISVLYSSMQGGRIHQAQATFIRSDEPGKRPDSFVVCFSSLDYKTAVNR